MRKKREDDSDKLRMAVRRQELASLYKELAAVHQRLVDETYKELMGERSLDRLEEEMFPMTEEGHMSREDVGLPPKQYDV